MSINIIGIQPAGNAAPTGQSGNMSDRSAQDNAVINELAHEFDVPPGPLADAISKLRDANGQTSGTGYHTPHAGDLQNAIDDLAAALTPGGSPQGQGSPADAAAAGGTGADSAANGGLGDSGSGDSGLGDSGLGNSGPGDSGMGDGGAGAGAIPGADPAAGGSSGTDPAGGYPADGGDPGLADPSLGAGAAEAAPASADGEAWKLKMDRLAELLRKLGVPPGEIDRVINAIENNLASQAGDPSGTAPAIPAVGGAQGAANSTPFPDGSGGDGGGSGAGGNGGGGCGSGAGGPVSGDAGRGGSAPAGGGTDPSGGSSNSGSAPAGGSTDPSGGSGNSGAITAPAAAEKGAQVADGAGATGDHSLSAAALAANPALVPYKDAITAASKATGVPPQIIGAQIWAESRGKMDTVTTNGDGSKDIGLVQIGQERLHKDGLHGAPYDNLDVTKPADNIMAGALHLKHYIDANGGNMDAGLMDYVGRDSKYVANVQSFASALSSGQVMGNQAGDPLP